MIAYTKEEMIGITELSKSLSGFIEKVSSNSVEKLAVIRHNKPEAIILSVLEYEKMKEMQDYLEDIEIANIIKKRVLERREPANMISHEEMMEFLKQKGCDVQS